MNHIELIGNIHRIVVSVFLLFFLFKTILLIANVEKLLNTIRERTKAIDMILGAIILISGIYMMIETGNHSMWMNIKVLVALASIPLGIISMKKSNKVLSILTILLMLAAYGLGEMKLWNKNKIVEPTVQTVSDSTSTENVQTESILNENNAAVIANSAAVYESLCSNCHGIDGRLGKFNAADLTTSSMSTEQKVEIITNGKGLMKPYKEDLSAAEIEALAIYLFQLK